MFITADLQKIAQAFEKLFSKALEMLLKNSSIRPILSLPQECFYCSMYAPAKHLCRPNEGKKILTCCRDPQITACIDRSRQLPWITVDTSVEDVKLQG